MQTALECTFQSDVTPGNPSLPELYDPDGANHWRINKSSVTARPPLTNKWPPDFLYVIYVGQGSGGPCNAKGRCWQVGPFTANKEGAYEFTVTVKLDNGRTFQVDPEMVVEGGG